MHILGEIYGSHTAVTHAHKVTHNRRRQRVQSPTFSPLCHWSRPELFHSICLWWNSRLLCHSQFAFLMTEAETTADKTWQGSHPRRQVTRLLFCEGPERERAEWDVSARDVTFWSASQRRDMWLRWRVEHIIIRWWRQRGGGGVWPGGIDLVTSNALLGVPAESLVGGENGVIRLRWRNREMDGQGVKLVSKLKPVDGV